MLPSGCLAQQQNKKKLRPCASTSSIKPRSLNDLVAPIFRVLSYHTRCSRSTMAIGTMKKLQTPRGESDTGKKRVKQNYTRITICTTHVCARYARECLGIEGIEEIKGEKQGMHRFRVRTLPPRCHTNAAYCGVCVFVSIQFFKRAREMSPPGPLFEVQRKLFPNHY